MSTLVGPCRLRLQNMHAKMMRPNSRRKPMIEPMTIPAMAPPLSPCPRLFEPVPLFGEEVALAVAVEVKTSAMEEKTGSVTS